MNGRRAFKSEESFLEKISVGAIGTRKVFEDMARKGHSPIELERGSMSFKIWKEIKIKRVRVPDILCVTCGKRIESRAKTKLEITMSHSFSTPERGWDFGLDDNDYIAFVRCIKAGDRPIDWKADDMVQYVSVHSMRDAYGKDHVISEKPKGATEGFEARITWPSSIANSDGVVTFVDSSKLQYKRTSDNRTVTLSLTKQGIKLQPLVKIGEKLSENQIVASIVPVVESFDCHKVTSEKYYAEMLKSASLSDRYVAAKALSFFPTDSTIEKLTHKMNDQKEHVYIRLEAASSLLKMGNEQTIFFFEKLLKDYYLENRLECVIALGEIDRHESCKLLIGTLVDPNQHSEIRAGAAWSLGELKNKKAMEALVKVFNEVEASIKREAARALVRFGEDYTEDIIRFIPTSNEEQRAGVAWALSKSGQFQVSDLISVMVDDEARKWIAWIVGTQNEARYINQIEQLKMEDKEVYFAVTVLWKLLSSWVYGLEVY